MYIGLTNSDRVPSEFSRKKTRYDAYFALKNKIRVFVHYYTLLNLHTFAVKVSSLLQQAVRVATQYAPALCKLTISSHLFARWYLFWHVGYLRHRLQVDL